MTPQPVNLSAWIAENSHLLKPPVNNRALFVGDDFIVQIVGGPNQRTDFHVDPYEEWFHQVKGTMHVDVVTAEGIHTVEIREGETWLLPGLVPHSPQRPDPDSVGIVIERVRNEGTLEKFQWYCESCSGLVHEIELQVRDLFTDLPPVFEQFYASPDARTCSHCGALHPGKGA